MAITRAQQYRQMLKDGKVAMQGGVKNYLGKKKTVTVPKDWQSSPDHPTTELAYITKAEKDLLIKKDLHNSLNGKPNRGPEGVMSLNGWGDRDRGTSDASYGGGNTTGSGDNQDRGSRDTLSNQDRKEYDANRRAREKDPYFGTSLEGSGVTPTTSVTTKEDEKQAKKEAKKFTRETKKKDDARRKAKLRNILEGNFLPVKIGEKFYANPYGLSDTELADLVASGVDKEDLAKNDTDALNSLFEKNDRFSGVNLEAFQNEFNLPKTGLTSLDIALGFAEPFLRKNSKKTKEFFSGTEDGLGNTIFGKPRKSVLEAGKYTIDGMPISAEQFAMLDPALMDDVYGDYMDRRMSNEIDAYGNPTNLNTGPDNTPADPCKGPNPPAYCAVNNDPTDPATPKRNFGGLAPRFMGSSFDFTGLADGGRAGYMDGGMMEDTPEGGIMDLESGRQMYFLGKLVKKATRAVKKVAKSPFGKAALFGLGAYYMPGFGIKATGGFGNFAKPGGFLSKILTKGGDKALSFDNLSMGKATALGFGIPLALDALGVGKDDDDKMDLDEYYRSQGINIADIRLNPYNYLSAANQGSLYAADGGLMRLGYQEGGDAEPVAKKTMPLLDMDGMEKDYREEGGFVPIGRMERADDVPARLSKNEFVFTADAVRNAGEGDIDKGAEVMYNMMKNLESGGEVSEESQGLDGAREMFKTSQRLEEVL